MNGIAYVGKPIGLLDARRALTDFKGNQIGICYITSRWRVHSHIGSHMHQIYATIDGTHYTGRSFGEGMIVRLSRCANQGNPGPRTPNPQGKWLDQQLKEVRTVMGSWSEQKRAVLKAQLSGRRLKK